eukprot:Protomagalhaensia_wolfi_Nauph_80__4270@NODE_4356_length_587_cov_131_509124_g3249_i1_p1_GENE_NODE_4356_length_587_cov_131_509124_g3249_i1NODE_4356_length_587_cov_131_509124_g3249_i1_p1_ORF_typecomplete_len139_score27_86Histone/PF00125_24/5_8e11CBFD_NFYB_HMF/PF00808_23/1_4e05CBFD_NFYB_HMF/PF00808_23/1_1e03TAFII28/PF04719_14/0_039_NODE_4356_length_587_cov_131_509124_g3249_i1171566
MSGSTAANTGGLGKGKSIKGLGGKKTATSRSKMCGLNFPVARIQRQMKTYSDRVGVGGAIFLAGVLEYLVGEVLELAGEHVKTSSKQRIQPRHIAQAIKGDEELARIAKDVIFASSGVVPSADIKYDQDEK